MISAEIIADSLSPTGVRLTTFEVEFHRFILPEVNTHRVFSRNYQSSRAVPVDKLIEQVRKNPAMPVHWGANQSGMVADNELNDNAKLIAEEAWLKAAYEASAQAERMNKYGAHKQIVNRVLEPFMWTRGVITATDDGFESFFKLRCHPDAQPEIQALAYLMEDKYRKNAPIQLEHGDWHLPYIEWNKDNDGQYFLSDEITSLSEAVQVGCSSVAQVSYRRLDTSLEKAEKIYKMLNLPENGVFPSAPPHFSPAEHCAMVVDENQYVDEFSHMDESTIGGNFNTVSFYQYRKMLEQGVEKVFVN